jgi:hypothetical protein
MEKPFEGSYSMILQEIKEKSQEFNSIVLKFENRFFNFEAHVVARSSVASELGCQVWLLQPPDGFCIPMNIVIE